jgi:hypothetical protein
MKKAKLFWEDKRNKYKFFIIFKFVGLEFTNHTWLCKNTLTLFKSELKMMKIARRSILSNLNTESELIDSICLYTFGKVFERAYNDNETFSVDFFMKLLVLDLIYGKYKDDIRNEISICEAIPDEVFRNYLEVYLCLSYYIDRDMNFKYLTMSYKMVSARLNILKDFLLKIKGRLIFEKYYGFVNRRNSLNNKYLNDRLALSLNMALLNDDSVKAICELMENDLLISLEIKNNLSTCNLVPIFKSIGHINTLKIENTHIGESCYEVLSKKLSDNSTNESLNCLSLSNIQTVQLTCLLNSLSYCKGLQYLTLSKCSLDDKDSKFISGFLKSKTDLNTLDISENNISNKGTKSLLMTLSNNENKLKTLILNANIIDHNIATKLIVLFRTNLYLTNIELDCSKLTKETLEFAVENRIGENLNSPLCRVLTFKYTNWVVKCSNLCDLCN